jgi:Leucine-rich repeat (LRR) protein
MNGKEFKIRNKMRIRNFIYESISMAIAGGLLAACTNEYDTQAIYNGEKVPMTFTAGLTQTRTVLDGDGKNVSWVKGDAIAIFDGTETNEFTTQDAGATASFTGTAHQAESYTAFYPFANVTEITATTITFNLPEEQTAVPGGFASGLVPSWASTPEGSNALQFHNLSALVKFTVGDGMAGDGTFILRGVKGESLTGSMKYTIGGETVPNEDGKGDYSSTSLNEVRLKGTFEAGKTYYFTVAPAVLSEGLSLFYVNSEGTAYRRGGNNPVTLEAGKVLDLGTQTSAMFEEAIINLELIEQIETNLPSGGGKKMASAEGVEKATKAANDVALYDSGTGFVKNPDGTVTLTEENRSIISGVTYVSFYDIKNVSGLEYFTNVTSFYCEWVTEQESLDLTALKNLTSINCNSCNILTSLNVSGLDKLNYINIKNCPLTSLDLTGLNSLTTLYVGDTELTSLELSHLTNLSSLECTNCKLQSLNVSGLTNLTWLVCANTQVESLNLRGLTKLNFLQCTDNRLTSLDLTDQKECLTTLRCYGNNLGSLELSGLTKLEYLYCYNIGAASLTLSDLPALTELNCGENQLTSLSLSDLPKLATLRCNKNRLTSLSLSNLPALIYLSCIDNQLTSLDVSGLTKLEDLYCYNNQLTSLDVSDLTALTSLYCYNNQLTSLDVSNLTALTRLYCYNNQLTSLDVSNLTALTRLYCYNNQLTTLSVGDINTLKFVECHQNQLSQINLANMANLSNLKCGLQTNADGTSLTATLEIHSTKIGTWNTTWSQYPENANVTLK